MNNALTEHLIDVRPMPPRERHPKIFGTWAELPPGESILLVNDHDPLPLFYQFAAEHAGTFRWEYLEQGPDVYRVRICKGDFSDPGFVVILRVKTSHRFAGQNHPPRGGFSSYQFLQCLQEV